MAGLAAGSMEMGQWLLVFKKMLELREGSFCPSEAIIA